MLAQRLNLFFLSTPSSRNLHKKHNLADKIIFSLLCKSSAASGPSTPKLPAQLEARLLPAISREVTEAEIQQPLEFRKGDATRSVSPPSFPSHHPTPTPTSARESSRSGHLGTPTAEFRSHFNRLSSQWPPSEHVLLPVCVNAG
uniref:cholecystokinin isoform X1 n=1 Tax=Halichoerus grypus TaxID=9711 RepID=UPI0016597964|nr:cholecystokinin isoform X1 [Halichoerus grypus]